MAALHIIFNYSTDDFKQIDDLQDNLERVIKFRKLGKYDGYELETSRQTGAYFLSASDSEVLFKHIKPVLNDYTFLKGGHAKLQMSQPDSGSVKTVEL